MSAPADIPGTASLPPLPVIPDTPDHAWDEAFSRVESYLRAHQIDSRLVLNRLAFEIISTARTAAARAGASANANVGADAISNSDAVSLAMREAERRTMAWFRDVLGDAVDPEDERLGTRGRIALVLADVPARWPGHFLSATRPPAELVEAMRAAYIEAGPELELTRMVPRPMDFGPIANVADEAWKTFARWPLLRAIIGWLLFIGLLAALWWATH